jgi:hypothetical protein
MKKASLIIMLALITNLSFSQEMKTLFSNDTTKKHNSYGGYGAPMIGAATLNNSWGIQIGAKGGMIKNHHFGCGLIGGAVIGSSATSVTDTIYRNDTARSINSHNITMGHGGVFFEYIFSYTSPIHISIPLNIEAGGIWAASDHSASPIKNSAIFIIEPGVNFEFNFSKHFVPGINVGYRFVAANCSKTAAAASGLSVGLVLKIGKF